MPNVRIPPTLRNETGGRRDVEITGATVREVIAGLVGAFPALNDPLLDQGRIQPFVNLYLDGTDVRALDGLETPVRPESTLLLLPAMAGGSSVITPGISRSATTSALCSASRTVVLR